MATASLMPAPRQRFVDNVGLPLANGMVFTFAAGTSDMLPAFQDPNGLIPHENPIRLDIRGEATIYWLGNYKVDVRTALGIQLPGYPVDNFNAIDTQAVTDSGIATALATFLGSAGSSLIGFIQSGVGALKRTAQAELRDTVRVSQFGAVPNTSADMGPKILAAHNYAQSIGATLEFVAGEYTIGPGTSFTIDPSKTRWVGRGPTTLRWSATPTTAVAVTIVNSELNPYETARRLVGRIIDNISICGTTDAATSFNATGLRFGNGTNQTCGITVSQMTISGWKIAEDWTNNVWSVLHDKCRILWGAINTPTTPGNWGENNVFSDCFIADGVTMTLNYGEWRFFGGSIDNSQIITKNNSFMAAFGTHFENPGAAITKPYVSRQNESTIHLVSPQEVVNDFGTPIPQAPWESLPGTGSLILDGIQYRQSGIFTWYSKVIGGGPVVVRAPQILAFNNFNFQVVAENTKGQLRNYGFESGDMTAWVVTANSSFGTAGTATVSSAKARAGSTGTQSCAMTVTKTASVYGDVTIAQTINVQYGDLLMVAYAYSRSYGAIAAQHSLVVTWLDIAGNTIGSPSVPGFVSSPASTDDGTAFLAYKYNERVRPGAVQAKIAITLQSPTGIGTATLTVDDVFVNVVS